MDMTQKGLQREASNVPVRPMLPAVDIWEDADGITLRADMPGVTKETLEIGIDGESLTLQGDVKLGESAELKPLHADVHVARYQRNFVLGADLDAEKIDAKLQNGVLQLRIPKLERAKPRRIEVKAW